MKALIPCCLAVDHDDLIDGHTDPATEKFSTYTDTLSFTEPDSVA